MKKITDGVIRAMIGEHVAAQSLQTDISEIERILGIKLDETKALAMHQKQKDNIYFINQANSNVRSLLNGQLKLYAENFLRMYHPEHFSFNEIGVVHVSIIKQQTKQEPNQLFSMENMVGDPTQEDISHHLTVNFPFPRKGVIAWEKVEVQFSEQRTALSTNKTTWSEILPIMDANMQYTLLQLQTPFTAARLIVEMFSPDRKYVP